MEWESTIAACLMFVMMVALSVAVVVSGLKRYFLCRKIEILGNARRAVEPESVSRQRMEQ